MSRKTPLLLTLVLLLACACSGDQPAPEDASPDSATAESDYADAVDKARDVDRQVQEAADRQKRRIDEQGEG